MFTRQLEGGIVMVKGRGLPSARRVTDRALRTKRSIVRVILGVARGAVLRRALEDTVNMALLAGDRGMFPVKFEGELRVVDLGQIPAVGGVTGRAVGSKLTVVMVVFQVAGDAALRGRLQLAHRMGIDMAFGTGHRRMFAAQLERYSVVIKVRPK